MNLIKKHTEQIKSLALEIGFSACGIAQARYLHEDAEHLKKWLSENMHAEMYYMENHFEKRVDARKLVENARSVISVILNYYPNEKQDDTTYKISKYAYGIDYHFVLKDKLKELLKRINEEIINVNGMAFVDSAPVLDRANAKYAGLGWIGKNSNLISKEFGSFIFIGELIVDIELEYDKEINEYCGDCTKCMDACPTNAIIEPRLVDSNKCISYLTIENKGILPENEKHNFNNWIFGCDICQDVCPWNSKLESHNIKEFLPKDELLRMSMNDWKNLTKEKFDSIFANSAVKRTKFEGLMRNIQFLSNEE